MATTKFPFLSEQNNFVKGAIVLSASIFIFLIILGYMSNTYVKHNETQRLVQLKQLVQIAYNSIEPTIIKYRQGQIDKKETLLTIRDSVRRMIFEEENGNNYIFMSSYDGTMLVQPFEQDKEMMNQWNLKDSDGKYIIRGLVETAQNENSRGYFSYNYTRPGNKQPEEKISYVIGIGELECYIGTGFYIGDLRREQIIFQIKVISLELLLLLLIISYLLLFIREIRTHNKDLVKEITMRKSSEESLLNERSRLRTVLETIPDMVWLKDPQGLYLFCNTQFEKCFGISESEVIGQTDYQITSEAAANRFRENDQSTIINNAPCIFEEVYTDVDGSQDVRETIKTPMFDINGNLIGVLGIARDITKRKLQEVELLQLHSYLLNIIASIPSIIICIDEHGMVQRWDDKMELYSGIQAKDALKSPIKSILPQLSATQDDIVQAIKEHRVLIDSKKLRNNSQSKKYESISIYPLKGDELGAVVKIDDVTERLHFEDMMIQSEKMLSVSRLAAGMAHEINNPLAGMIQTAIVMMNRLTKESIPANIKAALESGTNMESIKAYMEKRKIISMLDSIKISGSRASKTINNMLEFTHQNNSSFSHNNPEEMVKKSLEFLTADYNLKKQFDLNHLQILTQFEKDLPHFFCDREKIEQVLLNVLKNGAEALFNFREECSERELIENASQLLINVHFEKNEQMICIKIKDNGAGMDEKTQSRIFEPFFTTKSEGTGTGLGLSISYFIITETHKGTLSVDSQLCQGTTMTIRLPSNGPLVSS